MAVERDTDILLESEAEVRTKDLDYTEERLTAIWQNVLGVNPIQPDENYFDLGGDSILAVQLFAQIEQTFRIRLSLATLFEAPTIRELAEVLRRDQPKSGWSPLVAIQPNGSRPPLFCMHGAGGNVLIYRALARRLGPDQPFYGLQAQGLDGTTPLLTTIEEMAALYVSEIQRFRPHGPYLLGGYCGGGTIAYEVAQQLRAKGHEVALLALFDTMNWCRIPRFTRLTKTVYNAERVLFHMANFARLDFQGQREFLLEKAHAIRSRMPVWWGILQSKFGRGTTSKSEAALLGKVWQTNDEACMNYMPKPYSGLLTDIRPLKQYRCLDVLGSKWELFATKGNDVIVLPVYPAGMLLEPFVKHLADALTQCIERAITN